MAHGTIFKMRALPGQRDQVIDLFRRFERGQTARPPGHERTIVVASNSHPDEIMAAVRFDTTANYVANSNRPETDAWYRELRSHLAADPEWFDGTVLLEANAPGISR